jgi:3-methyladenine DNA glycosylase AlkD
MNKPELKDLTSRLTAELRKYHDEEYKILTRVFLKFSTNIFLGVRNPYVHSTAKRFYPEVKNRPIDELIEICLGLMDSNIHEIKSVAIDWLSGAKKQYRESDLKIFYSMVKKYLVDWADTDDFSTHVLGQYFLKYPGKIGETLSWCSSKNRWVKRSAAVALIYPLKRGFGLLEAFAIADTLLLDTDDMVQKGYGWMLKEASRNFQMEVFLYVLEHKEVMPRTALRYAIEKMPGELKSEAMKKA